MKKEEKEYKEYTFFRIPNSEFRICKERYSSQRGIALIMVIIVLAALLLVGGPFIISMINFQKSGDTATQVQAGAITSYGSVEWAVDSLSQDDDVKDENPVVDYGQIPDPATLPGPLQNNGEIRAGTLIEDQSGKIDINSLTLTLAENLVDLIPGQVSDAKMAAYKMAMWGLRPEAGKAWRDVPAPDVALRENYRPFRTSESIREISNIGDIENGPSGAGNLSRDEYLRLKDILRVEYDRMRVSRFIPSTVLSESTGGGKNLKVALTPNLNPGAIIRIDKITDPVSHEYNLCATRNLGNGDENGTMQIVLYFPVKTNYRENETVISILERVPVNLNTASFRTLRSLLWNIKGFVPGVANEVQIEEDEAEAVAEGLITERKTAPFTPDLFMAFDIDQILVDECSVSAADAANKEALIKLHAFNPYHPNFSQSTLGFTFASDRTFLISGLTGIVNQNANTLTMAGSETMHLNIWPYGRDELAWIGSETQYEFLKDILASGSEELLTGPNPIQAVDYGADAGMKGFSDDPDSGYLAQKPIGTYWNKGFSDRTSFFAEFDSYSKDTIFDGDKWIDQNVVGDQNHTGNAGAYDSGDTANFWRNDLTVEGADIGTDTGTSGTENDYLEYEMINAAAAQSKLQRDGAAYEGCIFDFWVKPGNDWDTTGNYYFFDITRDDSEMPVGMDAGEWALRRDFCNRMSFHYEYDETANMGELVMMVKDTSLMDSDLPLNFAEARAEALFQPGLWYHVQAVLKPKARGWYNISTVYNMALAIDGKPCWELDPDDNGTAYKYTRMSPGGFLDGNITDAQTTITLTDTTQLPDSGVVIIGNERIEYRANNKAGGMLTGCYRGKRGSGATQHYDGEPCSLFGYASNVIDFPLYPGGAALMDNLGPTNLMPEVVVKCDNTADGTDNVDVSIDTSLDYIDITQAPETFDMFPVSGLVEIRSPVGNTPLTIAYYQNRTSNRLEGVKWDLINTSAESGAHPFIMPDSLADEATRANGEITIQLISIKTTENSAGVRYPAAIGMDGGRRYIQIEDEWIEYGRSDCDVMGNLGIVGYDPGTGAEYYFYGDPDNNSEGMRGMLGTTATAHTAVSSMLVIPVFRVSNHGPMISNLTDCPKDKVTIVCVDKDNQTIEKYKEQMTINRSGSSTYQNDPVVDPNDPGNVRQQTVSVQWIAFTENVSATYFDATTDANDDSRLVKFPSGEMPGVLSSKITVGNSRDHVNPVKAEIDSFRINRAGYRPDSIYDIDDNRIEPGGRDCDTKPAAYINPGATAPQMISAAEVINHSTFKYIEIERNRTGANGHASEDFQPSGYLRMKDEIFAYVFVRALPYWREYDDPAYDNFPNQWHIPARYKLRLIERGCFGTTQRNHSRRDPVFILENIPMTIIDGSDITSESNEIRLLSNKELPPKGYLRIDDEIIGYTFKGTDLSGNPAVSMEFDPASPNQGYMRGRFGTRVDAHQGMADIDDTTFAVVRLFYARYHDNTPVLFNNGGNVTDRFDPILTSAYKKIYKRTRTTFGLGDSDPDALAKAADLKIKACVFDSSGNRIPIPDNRQIRILAGAGESVDWAATPDPSPTDNETILQEFIVEEGDGGTAEKTFDFKTVKDKKLEFRVYFEYLPDSWDPDEDMAIYDPDYDPASGGVFNWKQRVVIESFLLGIRGKNVIYSVARE